MLSPPSLCQIQLNCGDGNTPDWQGIGAGILIHPQWVLTAAHFVKYALKSNHLQVVLGDPPAKTATGKPAGPDARLFISVQSHYTHPEFRPESNTPVHADMALLKLAKPVTGFAVQPFLLDWDWYQSRWQRRQLSLQFWGRPFQEGFADVVDNDKRIHVIRREETDGVLGIQMDTDEDTQLKIKGGIPNGFSGGPVLVTLRSGEQACVGLTVQGGALFGRAASTSFALSTRLILPWLDEFEQSEKYKQNHGEDRLYQVVDAKEAEAFSVFNWRPADDYQTLYDTDDIAALLTWNTALSPLVGRTREQEEFNRWLDRIKSSNHPGLHVRVVHGEGGVGKTRFVSEWAESCSKQGWQVADASRKTLENAWQDIAQAIAFNSASPWLIVMDYPELAQEELFKAIRAWQGAKANAQQRIALVLLSRHGEERWQYILNDNANEIQTDYYPLSPLDATDSYQLLTKVLNKLTANPIEINQDQYQYWLKHNAAKTPDGRRHMEYPLMILGQAVCLAKNSEKDFRQLNHKKVLEALVDIAWRRLQQAEIHLGFKLSQAQWQLSHRLNMLAILFGEISLENLETLSQHPESKRLGLPRDEQQVLPMLNAQGLNLLRQYTIGPMTPDVFATAFAQTAFERMDSALLKQFPNWCAILLETLDIAPALERFGQRYADSTFGLEKPLKGVYQCLIEAFETHTHLMTEVRTRHYFECDKALLPRLGAKVLSYQTRTLKIRSNYDSPDLASNLATRMNNLSIRLAESGDRTRALETNQEAVGVWRSLAKINFSAHGPGLGSSLSNLSLRLSESGDYRGALKVIQDAVTVWRSLPKDNYYAQALGLAKSLNVLSNRSFESGKLAEALKAAREGVPIWRDLAKHNYFVHAPSLAHCLRNLSCYLGETGDKTNSVKIGREAETIMRNLAERDFANHASGLVFVLGNISIQLAEFGDVEGALQAGQENVAILRCLSNDDFSAHAPYLANSLLNFSLRLNESEDRPNAIKTNLEALKILRGLANDNFAAYASDLAKGLHNLSVLLVESGDHVQALEAIQETVAIQRGLADGNPDADSIGLAKSLDILFVRLRESKDYDGALKAARESIAIRRGLIDSNHAACASDLARCLQNLSNFSAERGNRFEALEAIREAVAIRRSLAKSNHGSSAPELASDVLSLSFRLAESGEPLEALKAAQETVAILRGLANEEFAAYSPDLANSLQHLSNLSARFGNRNEALKANLEAVGIRRSLVKNNYTAYASGLAMSLFNLSINFSENGARPEAVKAIQEAVAIRRDLTDENFGAHALDLSKSLNNLSIELASAGDHSGALSAIREAVEICRSLVDFNFATFAPDLAQVLDNLCLRLVEQGDVVGGLKAYEEAKAIRRKKIDNRKSIYS